MADERIPDTGKADFKPFFPPTDKPQPFSDEWHTYYGVTQAPSEFDKLMIEQGQRLACLKCATRMGESTGGTAKQVIADAQEFYNWVVKP